MRLAALSTQEAQARFERLPPALRIASLSPAFAAADAQRDPTLRCVHASLEGGEAEWIHSVHLRPLAGQSGVWGATSPYGYGGPLTPATDAAFLARAWAAWQAWCREEGVLAEFCRVHPQAYASPRAFGGTVKENRQTVSVDLTVPEGTVLGVLGPGGAGKTTTVRVLTTLLTPDQGHATVAGCDRAVRLVDQMLTLSRMESGHAPALDPVDLAALAHYFSHTGK